MAKLPTDVIGNSRSNISKRRPEMDKFMYDPKMQIIYPFQTFTGNEEALFQVADLFPVPIEIFRPDGTAAFANRAWLDIHNISSQSDIVGTYNVLTNTIVNEKLGLGPYVKRMFEGEVLLTPETKAPLEDFSDWCNARNADFPIESMYMEILCFHVLTPGGNASHFIGMFIPTRIYQGNPDIARAKEYIDNHWFDEYDTATVAAAVNLSRYHFIRLFKKQTGMTPYSYYQNVKVNKLKAALCDKRLTISEAFSSCGVEYSGNFAKIFRDIVGVTPSAYRNLIK
jgi:AraC-like DNA-binding protein